VLDSRPGTRHVGAALFHSRVKQTFIVGSAAFGVPSNAVAVTGNLTVVAQTRAGYVTLAPALASGVAPPTSTLNFPLSDTRANGVTVPLGAGGTLDAMYWSASTADTVNLLFDVTGYFLVDPSGATYFPVAPVRVLDSRPGTRHVGAALFHSRVKQTFTVGSAAFGVPSNAVAVTGNLTVVAQTRAGYVTLAPALASGRRAADLYAQLPALRHKGQRRDGATRAGRHARCMYWSASTADTVNLVFDVTGYFLVDPSGATYFPVASSPGARLATRHTARRRGAVPLPRQADLHRRLGRLWSPVQRGRSHRQSHRRGSDPRRLRDSRTGPRIGRRAADLYAQLPALRHKGQRRDGATRSRRHARRHVLECEALPTRSISSST